MTTTLDEVVAAGKALDPDQREIASLLISEDETDADEQAAIDAAWRDTIARRLNDLETGRVQAADVDETTRLLEADAVAYERSTDTR